MRASAKALGQYYTSFCEFLNKTRHARPPPAQGLCKAGPAVIATEHSDRKATARSAISGRRSIDKRSERMYNTHETKVGVEHSFNARPPADEAAKSTQIHEEEHTMRSSSVKVVLVVLLILLAAGSLAGCAATPAPQATAAPQATTAPAATSKPAEAGKGTTLRFALHALPVTWDINMSTGSYEYHVLRNVYDPLYDFDYKTYDLLPRGAKSYEVSSDGLVYTFKLNPDAKWSDGKPVRAQDYVYGLMRLIDPKLASPMSYELDMVKGATDYYSGKGKAEDVGIKALDDLTLQITVAAPASYMLMAATGVWFAPLRQDIVEAHEKDWMFPPYSVANGPYYIKEYVADQRVVLEKNPYYWRQHQGPDRVEVRIFTEPAGSFRAYEAGELDYSFVPSDEIERIQKDPKLSKEYHITPQQGVSWIVFDTTNKDSPVSDKRVRQALSLAIDREALSKAIFKGSQPPAYHLLPDNLWGVNPDAGVKGDLAKAKQLLADAGYPDGKNWPAGVSLHCNNIPDDAFGKGVAEALVGMWKDKLGIAVQVEALEYQASEQWWQAQTDKHYHMFLLGWSVDYPDPYSFYSTCFDAFMPQYSHWKNEEYSKLVAQGAAAATRAEREAIYKKAAVILEDELPHVPYLQRANPVVYKDWIGGDWFDPSMAFAKFSNIVVKPH
jgi:oligopeptide transport system substrate-binding protein